MKKHCLFFIFLLTIGCDKDLPNQFTSVEGIVTDYYSKQPVPNIPVVITEDSHFDLFEDNRIRLDTILSSADGYYYYEFINDSDRIYTVGTLPTEIYYSVSSKTITEGKKNTINLSIKPYKTLHLNFYNRSNTYNSLYVFSLLNSYNFSCKHCEELTVVDFKIVPEQEHKYNIVLSHYNTEDKIDKSKSENLEFFSDKNDKTINYYY